VSRRCSACPPFRCGAASLPGEVSRGQCQGQSCEALVRETVCPQHKNKAPPLNLSFSPPSPLFQLPRPFVAARCSFSRSYYAPLLSAVSACIMPVQTPSRRNRAVPSRPIGDSATRSGSKRSRADTEEPEDSPSVRRAEPPKGQKPGASSSSALFPSLSSLASSRAAPAVQLPPPAQDSGASQGEISPTDKQFAAPALQPLVSIAFARSSRIPR
jgi:hypothetical protein